MSRSVFDVPSARQRGHAQPPCAGRAAARSRVPGDACEGTRPRRHPRPRPWLVPVAHADLEVPSSSAFVLQRSHWTKKGGVSTGKRPARQGPAGPQWPSGRDAHFLLVSRFRPPHVSPGAERKQRNEVEVEDRTSRLRHSSDLKRERSCIFSVFAPGSVEAEILANKPWAMMSFLSRWQFPVRPGCVGCRFLRRRSSLKQWAPEASQRFLLHI